MSTSSSPIKYRRNRKLQGGGDQRKDYFTNVVRSHTRPVDGLQTLSSKDVPGNYVEHGPDDVRPGS